MAVKNDSWRICNIKAWDSNGQIVKDELWAVDMENPTQRLNQWLANNSTVERAVLIEEKNVIAVQAKNKNEKAFRVN